ncbi:MAG TPA: hypothetical protein VFV07_08225 [Rhizomicrobium sp.]|nr:hypothetical protein [Rhizomicrobium sp.]
MPRTISSKLTLLAGACALSLAFAPNALAAGGGGGGMGGGGHMGGTMATAPMTARPMVAPMDHKPLNPAQTDTKSHAPFHALNGPVSTPQPGSTSESSHAPQTVTNPSRPQPVTGTRIPPSVPQQQNIQVDPPPPGHGSVN